MSDTREAVFVNVMDVDPSRYEQLIEILNEGNDTVIRHCEGFISCLIVGSPDRSRVITVARWKSADAIKAVGSDPVVARYIARTAAIAKATPTVFGVVAEFRA